MSAPDEATGSRGEVDALARAVVEARLQQFGYGMEWIRAHEDPPDHAAFGCELIAGYGWQCDDEDGVSRHPDHDTYATEADNVMFVLEAEALADYLAQRDAAQRAEGAQAVLAAVRDVVVDRRYDASRATRALAAARAAAARFGVTR